MNYKTKNKTKKALDVILLALTLSLFNKTLISMKYHEVAGLIVIGIMLIHIGINIKTAKAMCVSFKQLPSALKACIITDFLLLINFLWFGISGVLCSNTILTGISSDNIVFKLYHMATGASALILLGIHIGLHMCRHKLPKKAAIIITVIFVAAGAYSVINSNFTKWASIPFTAVSQDASSAKEQHGAKNAAVQPGSERHGGEEYGGKQGGGSSVCDKALDMAMYFSITGAFTMLTYAAAVPRKKSVPCSQNRAKNDTEI